jgi:N-acetylglucosamine kinase-like BadF-type ATPase
VSLILGVDGGGTKTHAVITDETGRTLGEGFGGPTNIDDHTLETASLNLGCAIDQARANAKLEPGPFAAAFLGIAGVVSEADRGLVRELAGGLELCMPEHLGVDHDARVALAGGLSDRPGLVLIAGTGSACFGLGASGERHLTGGWGHLLADEGSGYWLGLEALRAAVRGFDGRGFDVRGQRTALERRALDFLGIQGPEEIMHRVYVVGLSRSKLAAFAPTVLEVAASGDPVAREIVELGAKALAETVEVTAARTNLVAPEIVMVGGILKSEVMLEPLRAHLLARLPEMRLVAAEQSPAHGACLLARALL